MVWLMLFAAGLAEAGWAVGLKYTDGFTRLWPSIGTVVAMAVSFLLLAQSLKTIPVGTAYAVWAGIGVIGVAVMGMILFNESRDIVRILCIALIVVGVVGLQLQIHNEILTSKQ